MTVEEFVAEIRQLAVSLLHKTYQVKEFVHGPEVEVVKEAPIGSGLIFDLDCIGDLLSRSSKEMDTVLTGLRNPSICTEGTFVSPTYNRVETFVGKG